MYYEYCTIDEEDYSLYDSYNQKYIYIRKNPINENLKDNGNKFIFKYNLTDFDIDYGEVIGSELARRTIKNGCRTSLAKKLRGDRFSYGVSSFYYTSSIDSIISSKHFVREYMKIANLPKDVYKSGFVDIDTCLKAMGYGIMNLYKRPYSDFQNFKQQYIDMIVFDCRFGNYDRRLENWMLYQDGNSKKIKMYPMYDNEAVLGIDFSLPLDNDRVSEKELILNYNSNLKMREIIPEDIERGYSYVNDILKHLLTKYPLETMKAYEKVKSLSYGEFSSFLERFPSLSDKRKQLTKKMFLTREFLLDEQIAEYKRNQSVQIYVASL